MFKIIPLLLICILISACGLATASNPTPVLLGTPTKLSSKACSLPTSWTIEYTRSGGIGGFNQSLTLQSNGNLSVQSDHPAVDKQMTLPEDHVEPITDLLVRACPFEASVAKGVCADCYTYELKIQMDGRTYSVQALDTTLTEELRVLIFNLDDFLQFARQ